MGNCVRSFFIIAFMGGLAACAGSQASLAPSAPEAAIEGFLGAVSSEDLVTMASLWGTKDGLASDHMDSWELQRRLTVLQIYLRHQRYSVLGQSTAAIPPDERHRIYDVRLERDGCVRIVPFTMVSVGQGWLVYSIDISAAGNPAVACVARSAGTTGQ